MRTSQESVNSNAPARHVPEMAAMTGLGMLSHTEMGPSMNRASGHSRPVARTDSARRTSSGIELMPNKQTGRSARHDDDPNVSGASALVQRLEERVACLLVDIDAFC